jgi:monoterpene epsilon-lactone hydrolase
MPSWQTRAVCLYVRATRKRRYRTPERGLHALAHGLPAAPPPRALRSRLAAEQVAGFEVVRVQPPTGGAATTPGTLVYFHGGAFVNGIARQHWDLIAHLSEATRREVHVPRYGLAPRHSAADALAFLEALHDHLRPLAPLHLLGDSAGGNLALQLAQSCAVAGMVAGLTLIAPWLDVSVDNPAIPDVEPHDPWLSSAGLREIGVRWAGERDPRDPTVSPLFGPLDGLPPTAVFVGTRDICLPDCRLLADKSPAVTLHVEEGSPHVYPLLPTPEGRAARERIVRDIETAFAGPA